MLDGLTFIINGKLEVTWNDGYYKSSIENVDDNSIHISIPIRDGQYIPLRVGEQVEVFYYFNNDIYKFYSVVTDRKMDRIPLILIAIPEEVIKVQRRKFVRVPIVCDIEYFKEGSKATLKPLKAIMIDLSGGGMRIKLSEDVKLGNKIMTHIPLGNEKLILKGEVVRIEKDEEDKRKNICGVSFLNLDERKREKLIRFIFQIMRKQMKREHN